MWLWDTYIDGNPMCINQWSLRSQDTKATQLTLEHSIDQFNAPQQDLENELQNKYENPSRRLVKYAQ